MATIDAIHSGSRAAETCRAGRLVQAAMEALLLAMVCLSPWAYGAVHPGFEFLLFAGVGVLVILWGVQMLLQGELVWKKCPVTTCLAGLFLLGNLQVIPMSRTLLDHIAPAAAQLYEELLPAQRERLPSEGADVHRSRAAGSTISLYPHASRLGLLRILAVLLVFAVVRNHLASPLALRRLAIVALVNGAMLSFFAFLQFFSSPPGLLYWTYPSAGRVFGPFIYRSHFACYVNLCIGLGLGLLWNRRSELASSRRAAHSAEDYLRGSSAGMGAHVGHRRFGLLQDPASLWICVGLALMISAVVFSLSRGGFLALVGAFSLCLLLRTAGSTQGVRLGTVWLCLALALGLSGWFGLGRVEARLNTLRDGQALEQSRLPLWASSLAIARDFPLWGTGFGTYRYIDPVYRSNAECADMVVDHVHNDYLEMLAESGLVGLLLGCLAIGLAFTYGYRAVRGHRASGGLALGAVFAFTTLVIHSVGDFGAHIPAITLLATVICAQLVFLGSRESLSARLPVADRRPDEVRWRAPAPVVGMVACTALAWTLVASGWRLHQTESLRLAAFRSQSAHPDSWQRQAKYLEGAVLWSPDDAELRTELGELYAERFRHESDKDMVQDRAADAAALLTCVSSHLQPGVPAVAASLSLAGQAALRHDLDAARERRLQHDYLEPALANFREGRDRGPLLPGPQLGLALHAEHLAQGDALSIYLERVQRLAPADPTFWYYCGTQELLHGHPARAAKSWRHCLELSKRYLTPILDRSVKLFGVEGVVRDVVPDRPEMLLAAATRLFTRDESIAERAPFLKKALAILNENKAPTLEDLHTTAQVQRAFGDVREALALYDKILAQKPLHAAWRFEYAQVLFEQGRLQDARAELATVLAQEPTHAQAYELLTRVAKAMLQ